MTNGQQQLQQPQPCVRRVPSLEAVDLDMWAWRYGKSWKSHWKSVRHCALRVSAKTVAVAKNSVMLQYMETRNVQRILTHGPCLRAIIQSKEGNSMFLSFQDNEYQAFVATLSTHLAHLAHEEVAYSSFFSMTKELSFPLEPVEETGENEAEDDYEKGRRILEQKKSRMEGGKVQGVQRRPLQMQQPMAHAHPAPFQPLQPLPPMPSCHQAARMGPAFGVPLGMPVQGALVAPQRVGSTPPSPRLGSRHSSHSAGSMAAVHSEFQMSSTMTQPTGSQTSRSSDSDAAEQPEKGDEAQAAEVMKLQNELQQMLRELESKNELMNKKMERLGVVQHAHQQQPYGAAPQHMYPQNVPPQVAMAAGYPTPMGVPTAAPEMYGGQCMYAVPPAPYTAHQPYA
eukprot:TRINITY_DN2261_c1_g2_i2.p1 TRINITY_DN2261_c1_g2~~TRINITY_DN2261_c1_g2_i2.p1  ORF type:complete len:397 (+),score=142.61 TRINITY_DN2261_c1_g2_i2:59-1249(+)